MLREAVSEEVHKLGMRMHKNLLNCSKSEPSPPASDVFVSLNNSKHRNTHKFICKITLKVTHIKKIIMKYFSWNLLICLH